jgi:hypothetical protein
MLCKQYLEITIWLICDNVQQDGIWDVYTIVGKGISWEIILPSMC